MSDQINAPIVAGIDGCAGAWVVVEACFNPDAAGAAPASWTCAVTVDLGDVVDRLSKRDITLAGIDMPVGLTHAAMPRRASDAAAREFIGPRRSSVFPTPARVTLDHCDDYQAALAASRAETGIGLSKQAFHLLPKIDEVDRHIEGNPALATQLIEIHPECSFAALNDGRFLEPKKSIGGAQQRASLLRPVFGPAVDVVHEAPPRPARPDDVLDALAVAWSANRAARGLGLVLGDRDARDSRGRPCTIVV